MSPIARDVIRSCVVAAILVTVVILIAATTGCETVQRKPVAVEVRTIPAPTAVPVACIDPAEVPPKTPTVMPDPKADIARKAAGAYVDMRNLYLENERLRALIAQCTGVKP